MGIQDSRFGSGVSIFLLTTGLLACGAKQVPAATTPQAAEAAQQEAPPPPARAPSRTKQSACQLASVYFDFDSSELNQQAKEALASDQKCAQELGGAISRVVGMTDPRGTEEYNLALGDRRAKAAARYLNALGSAPFETTSVGAEMASGTDENTWARDRRVDLELK